MTLAGTAPVVDMTLDGGTTGQFRVDVGSGSTVDLHVPFVKQHDLMRLPGRSVEVTGGGFGGTFKTTVRRLKTLRIGSFIVKAPLVGLSQATTGGFTSEDYAGNIGNRLLDRFRLTLDFERRVLWLEPGRRFAEPDVFPRAGVQLVRLDDGVHAMQVLPGSAAAAAGVREGDEVVAIDGTPVAEWTADRVSETLERGAAGSRHTLTLRRDGVTTTLTLKLRELF
jgi:membrane-associated protease RseP (regulator of RpoE activity)